MCYVGSNVWFYLKTIIQKSFQSNQIVQLSTCILFEPLNFPFRSIWPGSVRIKLLQLLCSILKLLIESFLYHFFCIITNICRSHAFPREHEWELCELFGYHGKGSASVITWCKHLCICVASHVLYTGMHL